MKKLFIFLVFLSSLSNAEFKLFANTDNSEYWVDIDNLKIINDSVRIMTYQNTYDNEFVKSVSNYVEFNCSNESFKFLSFSFHDEFDRKGKATEAEKNHIGNIIYPEPDTVVYKIMEYACMFKK